MKKCNVLLFSAALLGLSLYGLLTGSYYVQLLINTSAPVMYARIALIVVLLAYVFVPSFRLLSTKALVNIGGMLLVALGLLSVCSPTLLGFTNTYIELGDTLTLIEGGILAIILSAELPTRRGRFMIKDFDYRLPRYTNPFKNMTYPTLGTNRFQGTTLARHLQNQATRESTPTGYVGPTSPSPGS